MRAEVEGISVPDKSGVRITGISARVMERNLFNGALSVNDMTAALILKAGRNESRAVVDFMRN